MNFAEAFSKTIGKDIPKQEEPASKNLDQGITTDEMQKYIDAKFEGFQNKIDAKMNEFLKANNIQSSEVVETPKETPQPTAENIEKEGE